MYTVQVDNASPRSYRLLNKNSIGKYGITPYELLVKEAPETLQNSRGHYLCSWLFWGSTWQDPESPKSQAPVAPEGLFRTG